MAGTAFSQIGWTDLASMISTGFWCCLSVAAMLSGGVSANLVAAMEFARARGASIFGIVGRDGGFAAKVADNVVLIPPLYPERVTPHTEGLSAVIWHLLVTHPLLGTPKRRNGKA